MSLRKGFMFIVPLLIAGCAATYKSDFIVPEGVTVERDLTLYKSAYIQSPVMPEVQVLPVSEPFETEGPSVQETNVTMVDFHNESFAIVNYNKTVDRLAEFAGDEGDIFLIGHSHGVSKVGVDKLAVNRANAVRYALVERGVSPKRIHTLASWSGYKESFAPSKGVQVIKINVENLSLALFGV